MDSQRVVVPLLLLACSSTIAAKAVQQQQIIQPKIDCRDGIKYNFLVSNSSVTLIDTGECCKGFIKKDGTCTACPNGYTGASCNEPCPKDYFGPGCAIKCTCNDCDRFVGCDAGFLNKTFERLRNPLSDARYTIVVGILALLGVLITLVSMYIAYNYYYKRRRRGSYFQDERERITRAEDDQSVSSHKQ